MYCGNFVVGYCVYGSVYLLVSGCFMKWDVFCGDRLWCVGWGGKRVGN